MCLGVGREKAKVPTKFPGTPVWFDYWDFGTAVYRNYLPTFLAIHKPNEPKEYSSERQRGGRRHGDAFPQGNTVTRNAIGTSDRNTSPPGPHGPSLGVADAMALRWRDVQGLAGSTRARTPVECNLLTPGEGDGEKIYFS